MKWKDNGQSVEVTLKYVEAEFLFCAIDALEDKADLDLGAHHHKVLNRFQEILDEYLNT